MRFCITVESVRSVPCCDLGNLTQVNQQRQVSVYRSETDIRKLGFDPCIYSIGRRMLPAVHYELTDGFPLTAVLQCCHRTLLSITIIVTDITIQYLTIFVKNKFIKIPAVIKAGFCRILLNIIFVYFLC